MKKWRMFFFTSIVVLSLTVTTDLHAADTWEIDRVRSKEVLGSEDFEIIDEYVAKCVRELVTASDLTSTAKISTLFLSRSVTEEESASAQYTEQFLEAAHKHLATGFELAAKLETEKHQSIAVVNLLILIDGLKEVRLADLAIARLDDDSMVIRYWAVHAVTNPGIIAKLNSEKTKPASEITVKLLQLVESSSDEILVLMSRFAVGIDVREGEELLLKIANLRISKYANWDVEYEHLDSVVLNGLCDKLASSPNGATVGRSFGRLYSCVIQRYVKGRNILSAAQKGKLASVLTEIERSCVSRILEKPQATIKRALEHEDITSLLLEHSRLLGDQTRAGQLAEKLGFDYGTNADGSRRIEPPGLPDPPEELISGD